MASERRHLLTQQHKPLLKVSRKLGPLQRAPPHSTRRRKHSVSRMFCFLVIQNSPWWTKSTDLVTLNICWCFTPKYISGILFTKSMWPALCLLLSCYLFFVCHTLPVSTWKCYVPPKCQWTSTRLHGTIAEKLILFIVTVVRTSNPRKPSQFGVSSFFFLCCSYKLFLAPLWLCWQADAKLESCLILSVIVLNCLIFWMLNSYNSTNLGKLLLEQTVSTFNWI
jgi:hypothetical protein